MFGIISSLSFSIIILSIYYVLLFFGFYTTIIIITIQGTTKIPDISHLLGRKKEKKMVSLYIISITALDLMLAAIHVNIQTQCTNETKARKKVRISMENWSRRATSKQQQL